MHTSFAAMQDEPEEADAMTAALMDHGASFAVAEGSDCDVAVDPAALADFLDQQDQALHPDQVDDASALPDLLELNDQDLDDPTLIQREDHHH